MFELILVDTPAEGVGLIRLNRPRLLLALSKTAVFDQSLSQAQKKPLQQGPILLKC